MNLTASSRDVDDFIHVSFFRLRMIAAQDEPRRSPKGEGGFCNPTSSL